MKNQKKNFAPHDSFFNLASVYRCPSDSALKLSSFLKKLTKISSSEVRSAKISPQRYMQATIKTKATPFRSIFLKKNHSNDLNPSEIRSDSTMASFQSIYRTDSSKSPLKCALKNTNHSKPISNKTTEKNPKMYIVKQSKVPLKKSPTEIFEEPLQSYFPGIALISAKKEIIDYKNCILEYILEGSKNSVNAVESMNQKLFSGSSDGFIRCWPLPHNTSGPYIVRSYFKGSCFENSFVIGKHKKSVTCLLNSSEMLISGSIDGCLRFWNEEGKLQQTCKGNSGLKCLKLLTSNKLIVAGGGISFFDLENFSVFRNHIETKSINCIAEQSNQTFITGSIDCCISLWDIRAYRTINSFVAHNDTVTGVTLTSGFNFLSCSQDGTLKEWDLRTAKNLNTRKAEIALNKVIVCQDSFITGGDSIIFWNKNGDEKIKFHNGSVKDLHFSNDKNLLYAASWDQSISAWSFNY